MATSAVQRAKVLTMEIADVKLIVPRIQRDHRGFFSETYNKADFEALGVDLDFV